MPSKDELNFLFTQKHLLPNLNWQVHYMSSSEVDTYRSWMQNFNTGNQFPQSKQATSTYLWPIRNF